MQNFWPAIILLGILAFVVYPLWRKFGLPRYRSYQAGKSKKPPMD